MDWTALQLTLQLAALNAIILFAAGLVSRLLRNLAGHYEAGDGSNG